jgi:hypothetical protein
MAQGIHREVALNGFAHIINNANLVAAVIAFTPGETYATSMATANVVAQAACVPADFALAPGDLAPFSFASASKVDSNTAAGNPTHILLCDTTNSRVLAWTDETGAVTAVAGGALRIPAVSIALQVTA